MKKISYEDAIGEISKFTERLAKEGKLQPKKSDFEEDNHEK